MQAREREGPNIAVMSAVEVRKNFSWRVLGSCWVKHLFKCFSFEKEKWFSFPVRLISTLKIANVSKEGSRVYVPQTDMI